MSGRWTWGHPTPPSLSAEDTFSIGLRNAGLPVLRWSSAAQMFSNGVNGGVSASTVSILNKHKNWNVVSIKSLKKIHNPDWQLCSSEARSHSPELWVHSGQGEERGMCRGGSLPWGGAGTTQSLSSLMEPQPADHFSEQSAVPCSCCSPSHSEAGENPI